MTTFGYEEWLAQVPESIKQDPLWNFKVYPKALLLSDLVWKDTDRMIKDPRGKVIARQLIRSVGSICANIEEGHGRGFGKDNAYFQRVALGSARESRGWYYRGRRFLDPKVSDHRIQLLDESSHPANNANTRNHNPASCILHPASCTCTRCY